MRFRKSNFHVTPRARRVWTRVGFRVISLRISRLKITSPRILRRWVLQSGTFVPPEGRFHGGRCLPATQRLGGTFFRFFAQVTTEIQYGFSHKPHDRNGPFPATRRRRGSRVFYTSGILLEIQTIKARLRVAAVTSTQLNWVYVSLPASFPSQTDSGGAMPPVSGRRRDVPAD